MSESEQGTAAGQGLSLGIAAYVMWGIFPLYFPLMEPTGSIEMLAHRICWSLITMAIVLLISRRTRQLTAIFRNPRQRTLLLLASITIAVNWGTYIWGVTNKLVIETSLGYFINPLVTVLMGVLILKERLRPGQWVAIGIASIAILGIAVEYGRPPWVSLILAFSFGTYGLCKKQAGVEAVESLTFETMALFPLALGYLIVLSARGESNFTGHGTGHVLLLMSLGLATVIPLLCFGAAAIRVPMTTLGLLQYLAPIIQFVIGVAVLHESMTPMRWIGFGLVWVALVIFTVEALRHRRRQLVLAAQASAV